MQLSALPKLRCAQRLECSKGGGRPPHDDPREGLCSTALIYFDTTSAYTFKTHSLRIYSLRLTQYICRAGCTSPRAVQLAAGLHPVHVHRAHLGRAVWLAPFSPVTGGMKRWHSGVRWRVNLVSSFAFGQFATTSVVVVCLQLAGSTRSQWPSPVLESRGDVSPWQSLLQTAAPSVTITKYTPFWHVHERARLLPCWCVNWALLPWWRS